jgi:hypothetical protein
MEWRRAASSWSVVVALALANGGTVRAQAPVAPATRVDTVFSFTFPVNAAAVTRCVNDRRAGMWLNGDIIGTDSLEEIIVHERKHIEQAARYKDCYEWDRKGDLPAVALDMEAEAYCASLEVAVRRGIPRGERFALYIHKIDRQFGGYFHAQQILASMRRYCANPS